MNINFKSHIYLYIYEGQFKISTFKLTQVNFSCQIAQIYEKMRINNNFDLFCFFFYCKNDGEVKYSV